MNKLKLMIGIIGCLVTTSWGADPTQIIEGAVGEAESSVSFFRNEIKSTIEKAEEALVNFKENFNNPNQSLPEQYKKTKALEALVKAVQELNELQGLLVNCEVNANFMRTLLETTRSNENDE